MSGAMRGVLLIALGLLVAGCGFRPLYGVPENGGASVSAFLSEVTIPEPDTRLGELVLGRARRLFGRAGVVLRNFVSLRLRIGHQAKVGLSKVDILGMPAPVQGLGAGSVCKNDGP